MSETPDERAAGSPDSGTGAGEGPWWRGLTGTMWWVLIAAALGWLFDVMDQRIFVLSRSAALDDLLAVTLDAETVRRLDAGLLTAGEAERLLGLSPGASPEAPATAGALVTIERPSKPGQRPALVLRPEAPGGPPRKLAFVRPADGSGEIRVAPPPRRNDFIGRIATAIFLAGWATGGVLFGIVGDKWGRAFTMMLTILVYSVFTGLSALSVGWIDYSVYRFMTGMGVGGEFAAGAAFVAEVMPARARPYALGLLQSLSAVGNIVGSLIARVVLPPEDPSGRWESWRVLYVIGILPALLVVFVRRRLKEPARWTAARETATALVGKQLGAFGDLFRGRWRVNTIYGVLFAVSGVIGVWGISFWTPELIKNHIVPDPAVRTFALALQDVGAFLGLFAVGPLTQGISRGRAPRYLLGLAVSLAAAAALRFYGGGTVEGSGLVTAGLGVSLCVGLYCLLGFAGSVTGGLGRRASFCLSFALSLASVLVVFRYMTRPEQVYWLTPLLGFATLMPFGMYAIYFPELYPTRLRTTGTGFCYNVARYLAVVGLFALSWLGTLPGYDLRVSTQVFAAIYLVGIVAAFFAPETKDRPLAEE